MIAKPVYRDHVMVRITEGAEGAEDTMEGMADMTTSGEDAGKASRKNMHAASKVPRPSAVDACSCFWSDCRCSGTR